MYAGNTIHGNSFRLWSGKAVQGYPKQPPIVGNGKADTLGLDTSGEYFNVGRKPTSVAQPSEDYKRMLRLFTDNAFLILANRKRILSDSRMLLATVPVRNGLAYSGAFSTPTLGVYLEWWADCHYSVMFGDGGKMSLIWYLSGSPLNGSNCCSKVGEDGVTETTHVHFFIKLWPKFVDILSEYREPKRLYEAYTLPEVIEILKKEMTDESYRESIGEFRFKANDALYRDRMQELEKNYNNPKKQSDGYERKWHKALFALRKERLTAFYVEYERQAEMAKQKIDRLTAENRMLKGRLRRGEITNKEYQPMLTRNKEEAGKTEFGLQEFLDNGISAILPEIKEDKHLYGNNMLVSEIKEFIING